MIEADADRDGADNQLDNHIERPAGQDKLG